MAVSFWNGRDANAEDPLIDELTRVPGCTEPECGQKLPEKEMP